MMRGLSLAVFKSSAPSTEAAFCQGDRGTVVFSG